ncbi:efflux RND transporter periplasmic adaptor subunit [Thermopirellula anaerolimosa]
MTELEQSRIPEEVASPSGAKAARSLLPRLWRGGRAARPYAVVAGLTLVFVAGWWLGRGGAMSPHSHPGAVDNGAEHASDQAVSWWTCSMHPQIRQPKPGKCPICFMDLIPASEEESSLGPRQLRMTPEAVALAEVETLPARRLFPVREVRLWGRIEFDETRWTTISARFPGRLDRLFVDYTGVPVRKGDHLVEIYSPELNVAQQELLRAMSSLDSSPPGSPAYSIAASLLKSSEEKLRLWGILPEQIAEIKARRASTDHMTIYAPQGGIVITKHAKEGDYVQTGSPIYTIADMSELWVFFDAFEADLPWVRYGQPVTFETEAFPGEKFTGRVAFIQPTLDEKTRTIRVRVNVENRGGRLKPGMLARGVIESRLADGDQVYEPDLLGKWVCPMHPDVTADGPGQCTRCGMDLVALTELGYPTAKREEDLTPPLVIPASAPLITGMRSLVYVRTGSEEPVFESRPVVLGARVREGYVVLQGLREGEQVVVRGNFKIDSAAQLAGLPSMMHDGDEPNMPPGHHHAETSEAGQVAATLQPRSGDEVPREFTAALRPVWQGYLKIQQALAGDDAAAAKSGFRILRQALAAVDASILKEGPAEQWRSWTLAVNRSCEAAGQAQDIEALRAEFERLSQAAQRMIEAVGHDLPLPIVRVHCPMAFSNRGADWLQEEGDVANPYFGAKMLRCGTPEATYEPRRASP